MTTTVQQPGTAGGPIPALHLIDCDIHQAVTPNQDLFPYLPRQYAEYITDFGSMAPAVGYTRSVGAVRELPPRCPAHPTSVRQIERPTIETWRRQS